MSKPPPSYLPPEGEGDTRLRGNDRRLQPAIGRGVERIEDLRLLAGRGCFVDDLERPDLLHAAIVRSAVAHGVLRAVDVSAALALPGVHAVFIADDVRRALEGAVPLIPLRQDAVAQCEPFRQPVLAHGRVRYVGEPIAMVLADDPARAEDAAERVVAEIEPLAPVADRDASAADTVRLFDGCSNVALTLTGLKGDADAAFREAPYTRRESFRVHRHTAMPMETRALLAEWDAAQRKLTVFGAAKVPFPNRRILAGMLGLAESEVELIEVDVGGAFGVRGEFYPEDFLIPFAARTAQRPVKWIEDRREHFMATNHARDAECELEIACDREGRILALRGHARTDVGAYVRTTGVTPSRNVAQVSSGPYAIPHVKIDVSLMLTNKTPVGTYRAPGRFEIDFFRERLIDMAAADLGLDRVAMRRRNLIAPEAQPYELPVVVPHNLRTSTDSGDYRVTLDRCLEEIDWAQKSKLNGRLIDGRYHGLGIGCYIEGGGAPPSEAARLVLEIDGTVSVYVGSSGVGQGLETALAQIAADALGMPMSRIRGVYHGSTNLVTDGFGSYSSRSTAMGGSAIMTVAGELMLRVKEAAAARFGCTVDEVVIVEGREVRGPGGKSVSLAELAPTPLSAEGRFTSKHRTFSYGAHAAHVAVDARTGYVEVVDYVAVEDVGRIVNPHTLHGQSLGSIVQGLGGVLLEHLVYDAQAQLVTASFMDYRMPSAAEFPNIRVIALEDYPSPHNPLGAKGAGEGGVIPVGGVIANALAAALQTLGVEPRELPLSAPRVWQLMQSAADRHCRAARKPERG
ncbi:MAG TPA: xanthine dehydrogenase family protein molybdopterin-binding subunit [Burkholderiales bacterium]|nr:xanthine dehydrogenase family protein molybdopterin-binding subunit [Burkholderiales bacterium]